MGIICSFAFQVEGAIGQSRPELPITKMEITLQTLGADNKVRLIAAEVLSRKGNGPWNAMRATEALRLILAAAFAVSENDPRVELCARCAAEHGLVTNNSGFSQWASETPKGAAGPRVPGVTREARGAKTEAETASLIAQITAAQ